MPQYKSGLFSFKGLVGKRDYVLILSVGALGFAELTKCMLGDFAHPCQSSLDKTSNFLST